jgi:hypothetical protein
MNERTEEALRVILDILDNYDDTYYTKSEITKRVLESSIDEIIEFTDIITRDINRIREIIDQLLNEECDNG